MGASYNTPTGEQLQTLINTVQDELTMGSDTDATAGSIIFSDGSGQVGQDNANFFWDDANNRLGIGTTSPAQKLHINQSSATGAIEPLQLEQDDLDQPFVRFTGNGASGILTQTIVDGAEVTTITSSGFIRVNVQDEGNQLTDGDYYLELNVIT